MRHKRKLRLLWQLRLKKQLKKKNRKGFKLSKKLVSPTKKRNKKLKALKIVVITITCLQKRKSKVQVNSQGNSQVNLS